MTPRVVNPSSSRYNEVRGWSNVGNGKHGSVTTVFTVRDRRKLREMFLGLSRPVGIIALTNAEQRTQVEALTNELSRLTPIPLSVRIVDPEHDPALQQAMGFGGVPSFQFVGAQGEVAPIEMVGLPTGYQFGAFLNVLLTLGRGRLRVSHAVQGALKNLVADVRLEVLVSATCPNCPGLVRLSQECALANPARIRAVSIDAVQHPDLAGPGIDVVPLTRIWVDGRMRGEEAGLMSEARLYHLIQASVKGAFRRDKSSEPH